VRLLTQSVDVGPPEPSATPFWYGFWIATGVILVVVALVGTIITLVNRIEGQAATTVMHLVKGKEASSPFEDLVEANVHLRAIARQRRTAGNAGPTTAYRGEHGGGVT
jgi:hypothetical protein